MYCSRKIPVYVDPEVRTIRTKASIILLNTVCSDATGLTCGSAVSILKCFKAICSEKSARFLRPEVFDAIILKKCQYIVFFE